MIFSIIKNLKIHGDDSNRGLFGWVDNGTVKNLKLVNVDIKTSDGNAHVGAFIGKMTDHSTLSHCALVGGNVKVDDSDDDEIGGIVGWMSNNHNIVEYCYARDVTVFGDKQVGGLVGKIEQGDDHTSKILHSYFTGVVEHDGNEYFGAICGERYGQPMENNFFLDRQDGVRATGNQEKHDGSSYHTVKSEIKECTEEEMKQPLLFGMFGKEDTEYIYPYNDYPELKVFLRYNVGDSFYNKNIGYMDNNAENVVAGHLRIVNNDKAPTFKVCLEKTAGGTGTDFTISETSQAYFNDQAQLTVTGLGANIFENLGVVNTVSVPATVDSISYPQRHQVQNSFILSGDEGAVKDGALYSLKDRRFVTAPKTFSSLTIYEEFADCIVDYAFENMSSLQPIYITTWVEAGTLVDADENTPPTIVLDGDNIFAGCPSDIYIYVKDGTPNQLFLGYQGPGGYGYSNADGWKLFYSDYQDVENHMFTYFPVNRNPGGMSTLILGYPVKLPDGVTAWWAESIGNGKLSMKKIASGIVPALTPVLLEYEGTGPLYLSRYEGTDAGAATDYENNLFKGSVDPGGHTMTASEMMTNFLTLGRPKGDSSYDNLGFYSYHPKDNILPSYVAWLASSDIPAEAKLLMSFGEEDVATSISSIPGSQIPAQVYTMQGIRIAPSAMQKGTMYIVNGQKIIR